MLRTAKMDENSQKKNPFVFPRLDQKLNRIHTMKTHNSFLPDFSHIFHASFLLLDAMALYLLSNRLFVNDEISYFTYLNSNKIKGLNEKTIENRIRFKFIGSTKCEDIEKNV